MVRRNLVTALSITVASCGGSSAPSGPPPSPSPPTGLAFSPGGHWSTDHQGSQVNFYISETGSVRAVIETAPATIPLIGAGSVGVTPSGSVSGSLQAADDQPTGGELGCALTGTLAERVSLELEVTCSDDGGIVYDEMLSMTYQPGYELDSSLAGIAGNYRKSISIGPNSLNIAADGTIFGVWNTGNQCTVNGLVSVIDPDYNLFDVEWRFSDCSGPFPSFGDAALTGLAWQLTSSSWPPGSYQFILTGQSDGRVMVVVVAYIPV